ncbi:MAG: cytidine deaminase [Bacteroidetes bacterium]|nr:cytidine deaminase [Bacteroidota bacterium]
MKKLKLSSTIFESSEKELSSSDKNLLSLARKSAQSAYAPYSKFKVGSAVLLANGKIISGNNQENAAYPSGLCAERVALFYASAQNPNAIIKSIAITNVPCGACRQAMVEYEAKQKFPIRIIMKLNEKKIYVCDGIRNLLPLAFSSKELKKA